jgi:hypothetical protein
MQQICNAGVTCSERQAAVAVSQQARDGFHLDVAAHFEVIARHALEIDGREPVKQTAI